MQLEIKKGSENYACSIVKLPVKQKVEGLDNLVKVTIFGNDVLTQKSAPEDELYLFFPAECAISKEYLFKNNEFREVQLNEDKTKKGYFEPSGRVKAVKFKGVISTGYLAPVDTLVGLLSVAEVENLREGDEFTDIDGTSICEKYVIKHMHSTTPNTESRFNKKLKRFNKLVPNQFRFHETTSHLAKNLHHFHPEDIIVITDKWHGTSAVFSNLLIKAELNWKEKLARAIWKFITGDELGDATKYDNLYASRTVIKNQYINKDATAGFYGEDVWKVVDDEIKSKIEPGISLFGEIVGFTPSGKAIQKGYDYGCLPPEREFVRTGEDPRRHKFLVYRITYTKPDGNVIEYSWQQIKNYCQKYQLEHVKELYFGKGFPLPVVADSNIPVREDWINVLFNNLQKMYLEKDCIYCANKVPAEGIVVRRDGQDTYSAYKLKSCRFLLKESQMLDNQEIDIESQN